MSRTLAELLRGSPFQAYTYSYPHKTAYRAIAPAIPLAEAWADEDRSALFLYLHVPFCEQRCGFCNLYTQVQPGGATMAAWIGALERQAAVVLRELAPLRVARLAVGGGTPTFLEPALLDRLFAVAGCFGADSVPTSVEGSPTTLDAERVAVLARHRVSRVSVGVQSVFPAETAGIARHQDPAVVAATLGRLRDAGIPTVNADLMYGLPGQDEASLRAAIAQVIAWGANELYLYPLYIRPLTILGRREPPPADHRLALYRAARAALRERGWLQVSMRMFRAPEAPDCGGPAYRCQDDGMIGLGPGARSYTAGLHYSSPYAVAQATIRSQVAAWTDQEDAAFAHITHGYHLDAEDRRRRFVILSLLERGLDEADYHRRFGAGVLEHLPHLVDLLELGLAVRGDGRWILSEQGVEHSDVIGRWLYSPAVVERMESWQAA